MRVAVISDIHGNFDALQAVLEAVEREAVDELWSLGDVVGYGPQPNECCRAVASLAVASLAGNHDLGVLGAIDLGDFSDDAAASARWTRSVLEDESRAYLAALPSSAARGGVELFHASPRDPVWDYVLTDEAAAATFALTSAPLVLVGHTHVPIAVLLREREPSGGVAHGGTECDLTEGRWVLNPGSVGQPRDGDPRAAFLVLDFDRGSAAFHRLHYAVERTQARIREAGLPAVLAERLAHGV